MVQRLQDRPFPEARGGRLPVLVEHPEHSSNLPELLRGRGEEVRDFLRRHGAILFRGFDVSSPAAFGDVVSALGLETLAYRYRSTPRHEVAQDIYTASEYPAKHAIPMHCENAYQHDWPTRILFACAQPSETGGQTPLADMIAVTRRLSPACLDAFTRRGVSYVRNYHDGIDLRWQDVFQTDDSTEVSRICDDMHIDHEWVEGERLRTRQKAQGVARHPDLSETVLFNQATLFHVSALGDETAESLIETFGADDLPRQAYFGDVGEIPREYLQEIRAAYDAEKVVFDWQKGDVVLIDNMQVAHGREPFTGPRLVLASLCDPYSKLATIETLQATPFRAAECPVA